MNSRYLKRRKSGLCSYCNDLATVGRTYCERCKGRNRESWLLRYYGRKNSGVCPTCNINKPVKNRVLCVTCAKKHSTQQTKYQYKKNKELGICTNCNNKARIGRLQCAVCAEKASRRYYAKIRDELQKARTQGVEL